MEKMKEMMDEEMNISEEVEVLQSDIEEVERELEEIGMMMNSARENTNLTEDTRNALVMAMDDVAHNLEMSRDLMIEELESME